MLNNCRAATTICKTNSFLTTTYLNSKYNRSNNNNNNNNNNNKNNNNNNDYDVGRIWLKSLRRDQDRWMTDYASYGGFLSELTGYRCVRNSAEKWFGLVIVPSVHLGPFFPCWIINLSILPMTPLLFLLCHPHAGVIVEIVESLNCHLSTWQGY